MDLGTWISENFSVQKIKGDEYLIVCPSCSKEKLYFNVRKGIGFCHYASCQLHLEGITVWKLREYASSPVDFTKPSLQLEDRTDKEVSLPEEAKPLVELEDGEYRTKFPIAVTAVASRGVTVPDQYRFDLHFGGGRIWIPVYSEGTMVQYLGRSVWWTGQDNKLKYVYADGPKVGNYLFNYGEIRHRPYMTLVENTFNAIWLRDALNATSIFGSNLTDKQLELIKRSKAERVNVLFDEDAIVKAEHAASKLGEAGIPAKVVEIRGQPDDYKLEELEDAVR